MRSSQTAIIRWSLASPLVWPENTWKYFRIDDLMKASLHIGHIRSLLLSKFWWGIDFFRITFMLSTKRGNWIWDAAMSRVLFTEIYVCSVTAVLISIIFVAHSGCFPQERRLFMPAAIKRANTFFFSVFAAFFLPVSSSLTIFVMQRAQTTPFE